LIIRLIRLERNFGTAAAAADAKGSYPLLKYDGVCGGKATAMVVGDGA